MNTDTEKQIAKQQLDQLLVNQNWLIGCIDKIHDALCPGQNGTWQKRAEQSVAAAKASSLSYEGRCKQLHPTMNLLTALHSAVPDGYKQPITEELARMDKLVKEGV